ncbi:MAG: hypothetical protein IJI73_01265 [Kiritimatiellae bacterium]|nr:hypothetical protein [Kiritimatiellia bacterium]
MNHDKENKASNRTLAVGWFDNAPFRAICGKYVSRIKEVFFAWPGVTASRPMAEWTPERKRLFLEDIAWCRSIGMELDAIFNANCYGDIAISKALAEHVTEVLGEMAARDLFPEHLTTTSPFIATVVRRRFPEVKIRLSVNMYIESTQSLSYMEELFDSFYVSIDNHRSLEYVRMMADWSARHGKTPCIYVNSGCLRDCPFRQFHNNLHGHNRMGQSAAGEEFSFSAFRCRTNYEHGRYADFLRANWIRPEELPEYERYVGAVKLATRRHPDPEGIIRAYATYSYDGDLAKIMDPFFEFPVPIDNATLGRSPLWPVIRDCPDAHNCRRCGKCEALIQELAQRADRTGGSGVAHSFARFFKG